MISRSSQLDAVDLDNELHSILFHRISSMINPFTTSLEPEVNLVVDTIIHAPVVLSSQATYGSQLQNLVYRNSKQSFHSSYLYPLSKTQKALYVALRIVGVWAWRRMNRLLISSQWCDLESSDYRKKIWLLVQRLELMYKSLSILNFSIFLYNGKYSSLLHRILGIRSVYKRTEMSRMISFEFMNRQLVWNALTVLLLITRNSHKRYYLC